MEKNTYYEGSFMGRTNRAEYHVRIAFNTDHSVQSEHKYIIGDIFDTGDEANVLHDIKFAGSDTVEVTSENNDTFDRIISHSATIRLLVKGDHPEFYVTDCRQVLVTIWKTDPKNASYRATLFVGYLQPLSYQQSYDNVWDQLDLNCIDILAAMKYVKYKEITTKARHNKAINSYNNRTMCELLKEAVAYDADNYKPIYYQPNIWFDESIKVNSSDATDITNLLYLNDRLFVGDNLDDVKTYEDIVNGILTYLNCKMVMGRRGDVQSIYIFNDETFKNNDEEEFNFYAIDVPGYVTIATPTFNLNKSISANISREEVFNQIDVKANLSDFGDDLVKNPLDDFKSDFNNNERYCREYNSVYASRWSDRYYRDFIANGVINWSDVAFCRDWFIRLLKCEGWTSWPTSGLFNPSQTYIFNCNRKLQGGLIAMGTGNDLSSMEKYVYLPAYTSAASYIEYISPGEISSPAPASGNNYVILSGDFMFVPKAEKQMADVGKMLKSTPEIEYGPEEPTFGRLNRYEAKQQNDALTEDYQLATKQADDDQRCICYDYFNRDTSYDADGIAMPIDDKATKLALIGGEQLFGGLSFILQIGNKWAKLNDDGSSAWVTERTLNPWKLYGKSNKYFIGDFNETQNMNYGNYPFTDKGIIIPIPSGVDFGVDPHIKFTLIYSRNIIFISGKNYNLEEWSDCALGKDISITIKTDNIGSDTAKDSDIVYHSSTNETFYNTKEITFDINSALTQDEKQSMGVKVDTAMFTSNPFLKGGTYVTKLYDVQKQRTCKPEEMFVDNAYREHSVPRIELEIESEESWDNEYGEPLNYSYWQKWQSNILNKKFLPFSVSHNLQTEIATIKMTEINEFVKGEGKDETVITDVEAYAVDKK